LATNRCDPNCVSRFCQTGPRRHRHGRGFKGDCPQRSRTARTGQYIIQVYRQPALVETFFRAASLPAAWWAAGMPCATRATRNGTRETRLSRFPGAGTRQRPLGHAGIYSQASKSKSVGEEGAPGYFCPADISPELTRKIQSLAVKAHMAIKAIDVSRTDIRLNHEGEPVLIEINPLPGLTPATATSAWRPPPRAFRTKT
jgi:D-alanine-D-alanine ligase